MGATPDQSKASCWNGDPYQNVWFKFTSTATGAINVKLNVSGTGETIRYPMVALWNAGLTTLPQCQNQQDYGNGATNASMSYYGLTPGSEIGGNYFTIEKGSDGVNFEILTLVKMTAGPTIEANYAAVDQNPFSGISYY